MSDSSHKEQATQLLSAMRAIWPDSVGAFVPLEIGVHKHIADEFPEVKSGVLRGAISYHVGNLRYQKALAAEGACRHNLAGEPVGLVDEEAREAAKLRKKEISRLISARKR